VHIQHAVEVGALEKAYVVLDDWITPSLLCARCERLVSAAERSTGEPQVGFDHVLESPLVGYCYSCVIEWFAATGQGDLPEAIARVRAPHLK
jgi:hypothetical protein